MLQRPRKFSNYLEINMLNQITSESILNGMKSQYLKACAVSLSSSKR